MTLMSGIAAYGTMVTVEPSLRSSPRVSQAQQAR